VKLKPKFLKVQTSFPFPFPLDAIIEAGMNTPLQFLTPWLEKFTENIPTFYSKSSAK
jgi:hypothetical protein